MRRCFVLASLPARSRARSIAVSSAMLLVPMPRYSPSSRRLPPSTATTPIPIGPGFPEHAPSVHSSRTGLPGEDVGRDLGRDGDEDGDEDEDEDEDGEEGSSGKRLIADG